MLIRAQRSAVAKRSQLSARGPSILRKVQDTCARSPGSEKILLLGSSYIKPRSTPTPYRRLITLRKMCCTCSAEKLFPVGAMPNISPAWCRSPSPGRPPCPLRRSCPVSRSGRLLDGVEASILHLSLVGFALPLCLSQSYDLARGAPTSGVIPSNNPAHQEIYQTCVMIDPIL